MNHTTESVILAKITQLKKEVYNDWATQIGLQLNKKPDTIRAYARCQKGVESGKHILVLKLLTALRNEQSAEYEQLTT